MQNMKLIEITQTEIEKSVDKLIPIIYNNFIDLVKYPNVKHTKKDIYELLTSDDLFGYIVFYNNNIIAYSFGLSSTMADGRHTHYLSYIYVGQKYRHLKIGSMIMKKIIDHCKQHGIPFIVLTCDTQDKKLMNFYGKFGFIPDPLLKSDNRHDVLCLYLN